MSRPYYCNLSSSSTEQTYNNDRFAPARNVFGSGHLQTESREILRQHGPPAESNVPELHHIQQDRPARLKTKYVSLLDPKKTQ
ncbi:hypothetical protein ASPCAL08955 [Aspergillus calidoustus]|uniref:Uncharacterized protein n=1 Tax=Aspergillus calidoustus TaxID=454130 RepID=A0A0U5CR90_ASPCI|nr:hypothetical protein ASPCAL08955 [Aspergillus calidoustus]